MCRRYSTSLGVGLLVLLTTILAGCYPDHPQSTFDASGPVAESQLTLFYWILWAAVIVFIVVGGILLYAIIRFRRRAGDQDPPQTHGNTKLEIGWTILPAVVLAIVAVPTVMTIFDNANSPDPDALTIEVVGHQWWWEFRYHDQPESGKQVVTSNELHIPVGEVVNLKLDSKDVLHSFWIPKLAGKVDLVPNNENTMWIKADDSGVYLGQCAEFCGVAHALMRFRVIAETRREFDQWVAQEASSPGDPSDPLALEGKVLFEGAAECWACHAVTGSKKARGTKGPNLTHVARRSHILAGIKKTNQENLIQWLTEPHKIKPGNIMYRDAAVYNDPTKKLKKSEISALVAYLLTLKPTEGKNMAALKYQPGDTE